MSSAAQDRLNRRHSWEKLEQVLSANFSAEDLVVTLTYREDDLPAEPGRRHPAAAGFYPGSPEPAEGPGAAHAVHIRH